MNIFTPNWEVLFGKKETDYTPEERRAHWEEYKKTLTGDIGSQILEYWTQLSFYCADCENRDKDWCKIEGLPCTVQPIYTFKHNIIGIACAGCNYKPDMTKIQDGNSTIANEGEAVEAVR